jgi:transposase
MARLDAGPTAANGVCTLRGKDVTRIADTEFGVKISLNGAYCLLRRMNYSCLKPRPRHENADLQEVAKFKEHAPLLSRR